MKAGEIPLSISAWYVLIFDPGFYGSTYMVRPLSTWAGAFRTNCSMMSRSKLVSSCALLPHLAHPALSHFSCCKSAKVPITALSNNACGFIWLQYFQVSSLLLALLLLQCLVLASGNELVVIVYRYETSMICRECKPPCEILRHSCRRFDHLEPS